MEHFIAGKPRSGKGLLTMILIYEKLTETQNHIVTNFALRLDVLQAYLDSKGYNIHVRDRVRIIEDAEIPTFFLIHEFHTLELPTGSSVNGVAPNVDYTPITNDERYYEGGKRFNAEGEPNAMRGCTYVIDECQNIFRAGMINKQWDHLQFYLTQHGKLNHTVIFACQNTEHTYKPLRDLAQDFTYCRNHALEKFGMFRGQEKFTAKTYLSRLTNPASQMAASTRTYSLSPLSNCYDTSKGVGMPGGGRADNRSKAKGIPIRSVAVALAVGGFCLWYFFARGIPNAVKSSVIPVHVPIVQSLPKVEKMLPVGADGYTLRDDVPAVAGRPVVIPFAPVSQASELRVNGVVWSSAGKALVLLSDGRMLMESDPSYGGIHRGYVLVDGKRVTFAKPITLPKEGKPVREVVLSQALTDEAVSAQPLPASPVESGSWVVGVDGVSRLKPDPRPFQSSTPSVGGISRGYVPPPGAFVPYDPSIAKSGKR